MEDDRERREKEKCSAESAEKQRPEDIDKLKTSCVPKAISPEEMGKGSVWNVNSYHWETKQLKRWAEEWFSVEIEKLLVDTKGAHFLILIRCIPLCSWPVLFVERQSVCLSPKLIQLKVN